MSAPLVCSLFDEHRAFDVAIDGACLELVSNGDANVFARDVVDRIYRHAVAEETVLLPEYDRALVANGEPTDGPHSSDEVRRDHQLILALLPAVAGHATSRLGALRALRQLVRLLEHHELRERDGLKGGLDRLLDEPARAALLERFEAARRDAGEAVLPAAEPLASGPIEELQHALLDRRTAPDAAAAIVARFDGAHPGMVQRAVTLCAAAAGSVTAEALSDVIAAFDATESLRRLLTTRTAG